MEESISEWGKVIVLGAPSHLPLPTPLLKVFGSSLPARPTYLPKKERGEETPGKLTQSLSLLPFAKSLWRKQERPPASTTALAVNYSHPRFIEHPETPEFVSRHYKPFVPALLLTTISTFTAWYVYRLTGQKLELQTQVRTYAETLYQEKQARASLTAPRVKVFSLQGGTEETVAAKIFWDTEQHTCLMYLNQLPQTNPDQYFQLWFLTKEDKFLRAKSFRTETGAAELFLQLPQEMLGKLEYVLVSQETNSNSHFPEGPVLVKGLWP